jgi:hypothetical protein
VRVIEQGTGPGGLALYCADLTVCDQRRLKARS